MKIGRGLRGLWIAGRLQLVGSKRELQRWHFSNVRKEGRAC